MMITPGLTITTELGGQTVVETSGDWPGDRLMLALADVMACCVIAIEGCAESAGANPNRMSHQLLATTLALLADDDYRSDGPDATYQARGT